MKKIKSNFVFLVISLICSIFALSCNKDGTGPSDNNPNQLNWQTLGSNNFNSQGGEATYDNLNITIPKGVLSTDTRIDFSKSNSPWVYSEQAITDLYLLDFNNPPANEINITIKLTANKDLTGVDGVRFFIGYESYDSVMKKKKFNFIFLDDFTVNGNLITANLKLKIDNKYITKKRTSSREIQNNPDLITPPGVIVGATSDIFSKTSPSGMFKVYGHWALTVPPTDLLNGLDEVYKKLEDMGFDMKKFKDAYSIGTWPFSCYIYPNIRWVGLADNEYAFFRPNYITRYLDYIAINDKYINGVNSLKKYLGHEFFHCIQSLYNHNQHTTYRWFMEASSTWFETILNSTVWIPNTYQNSPLFLGDGLEGVTASDLANHGYPYYTFLKFLSNKYGNKIIFDFWDAIDQQDENSGCASKAISDVLSSKYGVTLDQMYSQFIYEFYKNGISENKPETEHLLDIMIINNFRNVTKSIIENNTPLKTSVVCPDFSAKFFRISFSNDLKDLQNISPLTFHLESSVTGRYMYLFEEKNGERTEIATIDNSKSDFVIDNVKDYAGRNLVCIIVNTNNHIDFKGSTEITLSNGNNNLIDGTWDFYITPIVDGCSLWNTEAKRKYLWNFKIDKDKVTIIDKKTDKSSIFDYNGNNNGFTFNYSDNGTTEKITGTFKDNDHWEGNIEFNLVTTGLSCKSNGSIQATRSK